MSDFFREAINRTARKPHKCSWCAEPILKNEIYKIQTGVYDNAFFTTKFHFECFDAICELGEKEFLLYENYRPEKEVAE